ncbi:aminoglycoside 2'-N-acetyltransferase [Streptomyces cinnamoneus]|uniref:Aminoglycoside 2'-N-acetyltransferase n=1 Tax=Streptomyces cinnamoneus TaxID=53446 RepID=A0A2G1X9H8_STRCJ|nr:GNAT family N-acetyltransferase [Streptomyces cinnamoneus]PHQ47882.1 aminoglycoside 2'-N-acetyltransferase [Streptomyces cinnamoneus]PPT15507.1 GNAT family N-acetyltransferase [Streptomyces cinnamoneus]
MTELRTAHTSALTAAELAAVRALMDDAFEGDFTDEDWDHTLCGVHALVHDAGELIAHGSLVQRRLLHGGRALRTGYVEAVAVRADRRRQGHGSTVMAALERVLRDGGYQLGALGASDEAVPLYTGRGWRLWRGPASVLAPTGVERTAEEDGCIYVMPVPGVDVDLDGELTCDWRPGDVW